MVPEVAVFLENGCKIGLNFSCGGKDEILQLSNLVPY